MTQRPTAAPPVVMFIGPPGSGKGTQAQAALERYGLERIETGALIRSMRDDPSPIARRVTELYDAGRLSPPPLVADLVVREVRRILKRVKGIVFDGSPRTLAEAERLLAALKEDRLNRVLVVVLDVLKPETIKRILRRWTCVQCKRPESVRELKPETCEACGGVLTRRSDDTAEIMEKRWEEYTFRTLPVIEYFERRGLAVRVDGARPIPDVTREVQRLLEERLHL